MPFMPFLRWAGGKSWLAPELVKIVGNTSIQHYHEPFLGGGALFFQLNHTMKSYLSDSNEDLINSYICVRDNPNKLIMFLEGYNNTDDDYYRIRDLQPNNDIERAARFIFLNQTCYNGIFRVNREGQFNVPFGNRRWTLDTEKIIAASYKLRNTRIESCDFMANKHRIRPNDLIFFDPPYTITQNGNGFNKYNSKRFSMDDQQRLSSYIDYIRRKGAFYILTNAKHERVAEIFEKGDRRLEFQRKILVGGKNSKRELWTEFVFTNLPEG